MFYFQFNQEIFFKEKLLFKCFVLVQDGGGLEVNPTESDSEDEWNYIKGDQANPENISLQPETVSL